MHTLARKDILHTQRGIGGGVTLADSARNLSLYELARIFEDPIVKERCMLGNSECSDDRACPFHDYWVAARRKQIEFLKKTRVQDLAAFHLRQKNAAR